MCRFTLLTLVILLFVHRAGKTKATAKTGGEEAAVVSRRLGVGEAASGEPSTVHSPFCFLF